MMMGGTIIIPTRDILTTHQMTLGGGGAAGDEMDMAVPDQPPSYTPKCVTKNPKFSLTQEIPGTACRALNLSQQSNLLYLGTTVYNNSTSSNVVVTCPVSIPYGSNLVKIFVSNSGETNATRDGRVRCTLTTSDGRHASNNSVRINNQSFREQITTAGSGNKSVAWYAAPQLFKTITCTLPPSVAEVPVGPVAPPVAPGSTILQPSSYDFAGIAGIVAGKYDGTTVKCPDGQYGAPVKTSSLPWDAVPGVTYPSVLLD